MLYIPQLQEALKNYFTDTIEFSFSRRVTMPGNSSCRQISRLFLMWDCHSNQLHKRQLARVSHLREMLILLE